MEKIGNAGGQAGFMDKELHAINIKLTLVILISIPLGY